MQKMQVDCSDSDWSDLADVEVWICPVCGRLAAFDDEQKIRWHAVEKDGWADPLWRETKGQQGVQERRQIERDVAELRREKEVFHQAVRDLLAELGDRTSHATDRVRLILDAGKGMPS